MPRPKWNRTWQWSPLSPRQIVGMKHSAQLGVTGVITCDSSQDEGESKGDSAVSALWNSTTLARMHYNSLDAYGKSHHIMSSVLFLYLTEIFCIQIANSGPLCYSMFMALQRVSVMPWLYFWLMIHTAQVLNSDFISRSFEMNNLVVVQNYISSARCCFANRSCECSPTKKQQELLWACINYSKEIKSWRWWNTSEVQIILQDQRKSETDPGKSGRYPSLAETTEVIASDAGMSWHWNPHWSQETSTAHCRHP